MSLQAAMSDYGNAVIAFRSDNVGVLEGLFGIALFFRDGGFGVALGLAQVFFVDEEGKRVIFDLDFPDGVLGNLFAGCCHRGNFIARPLDLRLGFLANGLHDNHGDYARQLFRFRGVHRFDFGVSVG